VDVATGETLWATRNDFTPAAFPAPDEVLTLDDQGELVVRRLRSGEVVRVVGDTQFGGGATGVHVSADGATATVVSDRLRRVGSWSPRGEGPFIRVAGGGPARPIDVAPGGRRVLAGHGDPDVGDSSLAVWALPSGEAVATDVP